MIVGIGSDLVAVARFEKMLARHGARLVDRLLGEDERVAWDQSARSPTMQAAWLAKRFAVKEATAKALGTGIRGDVTLRAIQTVHDEFGRPELKLSDGARKRFEQLGATRSWVSVSDERAHAFAMVVLERI